MKCEGSGRKPVAAEIWVYPACPECGKEFSAQGRKASARMGDVWRRGCPLHMRSVVA